MSRKASASADVQLSSPLPCTTITSGISKNEERIVRGRTLPEDLAYVRPELDDDDDDEVK